MIITMNSSLESLLNQSQGEEHTLLIRCKQTIQELQLQLSHCQRSLEIVEQQRDALRSILGEKDKRLEDLQSKAISMALFSKKEDAPTLLLPSENQRIAKTISELQQALRVVKEEDRKLNSLNEMLMSDKKLLTDIIRQKDEQIGELRSLKFEQQSRIEEYKASLQQIENLHDREVSNLRLLIQHSRQQSSLVEYLPDSTPVLYSSSKPNRENYPYKSGIRKNHHLRLTSEYSTQSREPKKLELNREASDSVRRQHFAHSNSSRYKSNINLQREVNDLYGIVHNARAKALK